MDGIKANSIYGDKQEIKQETKIEIQWSTPDNKMVDVTANNNDEVVINEPEKIVGPCVMRFGYRLYSL